jgi:hypothetical protein
MKTYLPHCFLLIAGVALLYGCSTQTKFASSFGKRRYTKGFYCDRAGAIKQVASANAAKAIEPMPVLAKSHEVDIKIGEEINHTILPVAIKISNRAIGIKHQSRSQYLTTFQSQPQVFPAISSINSHHFNKADGGGGSTDNGSLSISGGVLAIVCPLLLYFGAILAILGSGGTSIVGLVLFGFIGDIVGVVLCVVALANNDKYSGIAIAGLAFNILFYALLFSGALSRI